MPSFPLLRPLRPLRPTLPALLAVIAILATRAPAAERTFAIAEPFGLAWGPERVTYAVEFAAGEVAVDGCRLSDDAGRPVPVQLADVERWPDGSVRRADVAFSATLTPGQRRAWKLVAGQAAVAQPSTALVVTQSDRTIELANALTGLRVAGGAAVDGAAVADPPPPIQGVRLPGIGWIGRGWWRTDARCDGYRAEVVERGPVFARVRLRYGFVGGHAYEATVELDADRDLAVVTESFDLGAGETLPMSGVAGMRADQRYGYVLPTFDPPEQALSWDWWAQTMAKLPTPHVYGLTFSEGFAPDSAEFLGQSRYGNLSQGDGGLRYDRDGRFAYINPYLQWGDEESVWLGLYDRKKPEAMLAVVGLRPSRWLHPDVAPHPDRTLHQYVQTACITFERKTTGEAWFRAPVSLGKRCYAIGGVRRVDGEHIVHDRSGAKTVAGVRGDLALESTRLGVVGLDDVKDWVLDYDEPARYPRVFVPEGDRARLEARRARIPIEQARADLAARTGPTDADRKVIDDALAHAQALVRNVLQVTKDTMDFGLEEGPIGHLAEDALASPACTPERARELRRWLAAIMYLSQDHDLIPPRTAGFAWGSANMMAQVQCRACRIAALLPNHPSGKAWRDALARFVTLYVESQIADSGVTLECPHYGSMAITMPAMALAALASCGDIDIERARQRLRAAAHARLGLLLPPDPRGGFRSLSAEGDGYYERDGVFGVLAGFFQESDPALAAQLAWAQAQTNGVAGDDKDEAWRMIDGRGDGAAPALASEHYAGFAAVLRDGFPRADEFYAQIYAGSFCWGHGHNDRGTWTLYAKGAPLMMDFAAMYTPSMRELWLHPGGLTFDHDETVREPGDDARDGWWHASDRDFYRTAKVAPFTVVEPSPSPVSTAAIDRLGEVDAFRTSPVADFARMRRRLGYLRRVPYMLADVHGRDMFDDGPCQEIWLDRPFTWTRRFVLVKDRDPRGHEYLVVRDELPGNAQLDPYLNLWFLADRLDRRGNLTVAVGQHGVDVHCYVAEPAEFAAQERVVGHGNGFGFADHYRRTFGKPFREEQRLLRIPQAKRDGGYFVALVPIAQGEPAPKFSTVLDGQALRVEFPDRIDTVVLRGDGGAPLQIEGRAIRTASAVVTRRGDAVDAVELDGDAGGRP